MDAVIFDWGGTLTPWKTMDGRAWWRIAAALAAPVWSTRTGRPRWPNSLRRPRSECGERPGGEPQRHLEDLLAMAGLTADDAFCAIHDAEHDWATFIDPEAPPLLTALRDAASAWVCCPTPRGRGRSTSAFRPRRARRAIDGAVYTSEIPWTKPHPEAFRAAMAASASDPGRCVFVGDRPSTTSSGPQVGMRTVLVPHSNIPAVQRGHTQGEPDAVIQRLADLLPLVDRWRAGG